MNLGLQQYSALYVLYLVLYVLLLYVSIQYHADTLMIPDDKLPPHQALKSKIEIIWDEGSSSKWKKDIFTIGLIYVSGNIYVMCGSCDIIKCKLYTASYLEESTWVSDSVSLLLSRRRQPGGTKDKYILLVRRCVVGLCGPCVVLVWSCTSVKYWKGIRSALESPPLHFLNHCSTSGE